MYTSAPGKTVWRRQLNDLIPSSEIDSPSAKDRNHALVSVLKDLSLRVSDDDRRRIEDALQDVSTGPASPDATAPTNTTKSDDEVGSPVSISSSSRASAPQPFSQHSRMHPFAPSSSYVPLGAETSPTSDQSPLPRMDGIVPEDSGDEDGGELPSVVEAGFLGQISEVQWLQTLRSRVQALDTVLLGPPDTTAPLSQPPSPTFTASPTSLAATPLEQIALTNYYLDEEGIKLTDCGNPFELPPEHTAALLFQCFTQTIQSSFPILPPTIEHQLLQYYTLVRNGQAIHCPEKWFALVNLVFAIGAKFSHLVQADWRADELDHIVYLSRAFQLLSMNDTIVVLTTPDLLTTQASLSRGFCSTMLNILGCWTLCDLLHDCWPFESVSMRNIFARDYLVYPLFVPCFQSMCLHADTVSGLG